MTHLSVIIPCLDEGEIVVPRLAALQSLRTAGQELILVDGGSGDGTPELAAPLVDLLLSSPPGRACQMNRGAASASGEILWFLHLDTAPYPGADSDILAHGAGGTVWGRFDLRLSGAAASLRLVETLMNWRSCLTGIATGDQGIFVTRSAFEQVGGYPEIPLMEDIALSRRLKRLCRPVCIHRRLVTSSRRWERRGIWRTVALMGLLRLGYALGASPARLARLYRPCSSPRHAS